MTAITLVVPMLVIFLLTGLFVSTWSFKVWSLIIGGVALVLIANLALIFI